MAIRILERDEKRNMLLIKNGDKGTFDVLVLKDERPGQLPKPFYENFQLLEHYLTEAEARAAFKALQSS